MRHTCRQMQAHAHRCTQMQDRSELRNSATIVPTSRSRFSECPFPSVSTSVPFCLGRAGLGAESSLGECSWPSALSPSSVGLIFLTLLGRGEGLKWPSISQLPPFSPKKGKAVSVQARPRQRCHHGVSV